MKETYKGYNIEYLEHTEKFHATIDQSSYDNQSLSVVKKYIDNLEKKDFKRVDIIINDYGQYRFGTVTSCVKATYGNGLDCWLSLGGSRTKKDIESVYLDNENNRGILEKITEREEAIKVIKKTIRVLQSSFEKYTYEINS